MILGIDQGSSQTRAVLFTDDGKRRLGAATPLRTYCPHLGRVEHHPNELLKGVFKVVRHLLGNTDPKKIASCGIANQRSTVLCWDRKTGEPLSPAVSWRCTEPAGCNASGDLPDIFAKTGLPLSPHYSALKLSWLLDRIGRNKKNLIAGTVNTFLIWHMTGGRHLTDPTNAQRMLLYNIHCRNWDDDLLRYFNIPRHILPDILPNMASYGDGVIGGARIPITASIGDQQSALIGLGGLTAGSANVNYGTGGFFLLHTGQKPLVVPGLLVSIALSDKRQTSYLVEGTVNAVGTVFTWLWQVGILRRLKDIDSAYRRARETVFFLPALNGLGAPYWNRAATGRLSGLTPSTQKEDIIRGAVEGIAHLMNAIYQKIPNAKRRIQTIVATGGGAGITSLIQFQADLFGAKIAIAADTESTVRGAAFLAGKGAGVTDAARFHFAPIAKTVVPRITPQERRRLLERWKAIVDREIV